MVNPLYECNDTGLRRGAVTTGLSNTCHLDAKYRCRPELKIIIHYTNDKRYYPIPLKTKYFYTSNSHDLWEY